MRILHTSDWHIGRSLYGRKRYEEFESFLRWLTVTIREEKVDALLVAGDVFDSATPSNRSQELYYRFLCSVATSSCRHIVIIAGNHDSPSFLNAPKELLKALNVHVVGNISENREDEVLLLDNEDGTPELIVCAVPYLRDRDIRLVEAGESVEDKEKKLIEGVKQHYREVALLAEQKRKELDIKIDKKIPIVAMGHLFTAGGQTVDGDGVRELYIGALARITADKLFDDNGFDYMALGHLHLAQKINGSEVMRYSGSPLPMGFSEIKQEKTVFLVELSSSSPVSVHPIKVPLFQQLERIKGTWEEISIRIHELSLSSSSSSSPMIPGVWLEIIYDGDDVIGDLQERLERLILGTSIEILHIKNNRIYDRVLNQVYECETLDDLNENDIFERCLLLHEIPEEQRATLLCAYQEIISSINESDVRAE